MKKLIIVRYIGALVYVLVGIATGLISFLSKRPADYSEMQWHLNLSHITGLISLCIVYFFAGKKFYDVCIKKLIVVFLLWTLAVIAANTLVWNRLLFLAGGFPCFTTNVTYIGITDNIYLRYIISFFTEMTVLISGIFIGRVKAGKTVGKSVIFLFKFCGVIVGCVTAFLVRWIFILESPRAPIGYLSEKGMDLGWIISMLPVSLWYIYAGFKSFRTNLKITLPVVLLWDALGVFLWYIFKSWKLLAVNGGYFAFLEGICYITEDRYLLLSFICAYILETLFITTGIFLGRYFNKRKALKEETTCQTIAE